MNLCRTASALASTIGRRGAATLLPVVAYVLFMGSHLSFGVRILLARGDGSHWMCSSSSTLGISRVSRGTCALVPLLASFLRALHDCGVFAPKRLPSLAFRSSLWLPPILRVDYHHCLLALCPSISRFIFGACVVQCMCPLCCPPRTSESSLVGDYVASAKSETRTRRTKDAFVRPTVSQISPGSRMRTNVPPQS